MENRKIAYFDCFSGISGDMTLGAFIGLGVPSGWLQETIARLPLKGFELAVEPVMRNGITACRVRVVIEDGAASRTYADIRDLIGGSPLPEPVIRRSLEAFERIAEAESDIHNCPKDALHFHEVGAVDAIVDIVGAMLCADRLGHGVRCVEDPALVAHLRERQVPLEVCPTSNICLGVYPGYDAHPLRQLWDSGLMITVNSDDPALFGADLNHEYEALVDHFGFGADELERLSLNSLRASLLPQADRERLETAFRAQFAQLRKELSSA